MALPERFAAAMSFYRAGIIGPDTEPRGARQRARQRCRSQVQDEVDALFAHQRERSRAIPGREAQRGKVAKPCGGLYQAQRGQPWPDAEPIIEPIENAATRARPNAIVLSRNEQQRGLRLIASEELGNTFRLPRGKARPAAEERPTQLSRRLKGGVRRARFFRHCTHLTERQRRSRLADKCRTLSKFSAKAAMT